MTTQVLLPQVYGETPERLGVAGLTVTPTTGIAPLAVTGTATLDGLVAAGGSYTYTWQFAEGSRVSGRTAHHVYEGAGVYTVTLTAHHPLGEQTVQQAVTVYDLAADSVGWVDEAGGRVTAREGDLWLDFAPGALREAHAIFIEQIDRTTVTTDTVDGSPQVEAPGFGLPFRQVELHAVRLRDSQWLTHTQFSAPVTMTHAYGGEVSDQLLPQSLHFIHWDETANNWTPLTSTVDLEGGQVWAPLAHFSDYGVAGEQAVWQTPTLDAAEVSLAKGQSSYRYALPLPAGPGGFAPKVTLSYSSGLINGMVGAKNSDGGWVGLGWTLDLGHISEKSLSLNGISGELKLGKDGFYYLEEDPSLRIRRIEGSSGGKAADRWEVTDRGGTVYHFGRAAAGGGSVVLFRHSWSRERCAVKVVAYKLYQVVDAGGNTLDISYHEMPNTDECGPEPLVRESYPHQLRYTTNPSANDHHAEYVVEFELEDKGYSAAHEDAHGDIHHRLRRIHLWHDDPTHGRQPIRTLRLGYHTSVQEKYSLLTSLAVSSGPGDEAATLPELVFGYSSHEVGSVGSGTFHRPFLATVQNGYGGGVSFTYATEKYEQQALFQVVTKRTVVEAVGRLTAEQHYHYQGGHIKLNSRCREWVDDVCRGGRRYWGGFERFFGFGRVEVQDPAGGWQRHDFHNRHESLLNGRPRATWVYDGLPAGGGKLHQASQHEWTERTTPAGVKFVTQVAGRQYRCFGRSQGEELTPCPVQRTVTHGDEWGNPVQETLYGADGAARHTAVHGREQHADGWRLRPLYEQVFAGEQLDRNQLLAETLLLYDPAQWRLSAVVRTWAGDGRYLDTYRSYDGYGNRTSETLFNQYGTGATLARAGSRTTTVRYDAHGLLPVQVTNPLGQATRTSYDYRFQQPLTVSDANGATTSTHYDDFGRLVGVDLPGCPQAVVASYGDWAQPYSERLQQRIDDCRPGEGASYTDLVVFYDSLGRKVQAQQAGDANETILTSVAYDAKGRLVTSGVPYPIPGAPGQFRPPDWPAGATRTEYDALDRPLRVIAPDGSVMRSEYGQDLDGPAPTLGALVRTFDANGHRKEQVSDEWGNLSRVREYSGGGVGEPPHTRYSELVYTYDVQNRLVAVRDAAGHTTQLEYDVLGRKSRMVDPDMGEWRYSYDPLGNLTSQTDALGVVTQLRYDELNRLHKKWYVAPPNSGILSTTGATYHYDRLPGGEAVPFGLGRRVQLDDPAGTVSYRYDAHGRVTSEARLFTGAYAALANNRDNGVYYTRSIYNAAGWVKMCRVGQGAIRTSRSSHIWTSSKRCKTGRINGRI